MISMEGKNTEMFTVRLKNPKEARGSSVTVEMFANGPKWCPVKAYKLWRKTTFLESSFERRMGHATRADDHKVYDQAGGRVLQFTQLTE